MRACNTCGEIKNIDDFAKGDRYRDGRRPTCKECWNARMRKVRPHAEDRDFYKFIERICILSTHDYSPSSILEIIKNNPFKD